PTTEQGKTADAHIHSRGRPGPWREDHGCASRSFLAGTVAGQAGSLDPESAGPLGGGAGRAPGPRRRCRAMSGLAISINSWARSRDRASKNMLTASWTEVVHTAMRPDGALPSSSRRWRMLSSG